MDKSVNTHSKLRYFLTNKIFLLQVMYKYLRILFFEKCVIITRFFLCLCSALWKGMIFTVLSSVESVRDTVQYRYCIFSLFSLLLRIRLKRHNPLISYVRERESTL